MSKWLGFGISQFVWIMLRFCWHETDNFVFCCGELILVIILILMLIDLWFEKMIDNTVKPNE